MAVCTLSFASASEGSLPLVLRAAIIGALLIRVRRIRAFALDSGVPLYLYLLLLFRLLISRSFPFIVNSALAGLLIGGEASKASGLDIMDLLYDVLKFEGGSCVCFEC